jgi:hypothetical protein
MAACSRACFLVLPILLSSSTTWATPSTSQDPSQGDLAQRVQIVLENEAAIESLRGPIGELTRSIQNLALPGERARTIFADHVNVVDLANPSPSERAIVDIDARESGWELGKPLVRDAKSLALWTGFLESVDYFENASFFSIRGSFTDEDPRVFHSPSGFKGVARMKDGTLAWIRASVDLDWRQSGESDSSIWKLQAFVTTSFDLMLAPSTLYDDVTRDMLSDGDLARAARSLRDEFLIGWVRGVGAGEIDLDEFMAGLIGALEDGSFRADWTHMSVVDFDRDGWDDVYVMPYNARALFFRNHGDGTFEEIATSIGLGLDGVNAALFADIDNDSDDDVILSFYPDETKVFENTGGTYTLKQDGLPSLTLSLTAVDYDQDGLLDLYLGRYNGVHIGAMAAALERARRSGEEVAPNFPGMTAEESRELASRLLGDGEPFVNIPGPPNVLLRNVGGRFERAKDAGPADPYYQTMAAGWSDIDLDGDMDLYVVNEGGPNQLFRNDGGGRFVDITDDATRDVGFGMGVSFGDFDDDGRQDIYVTNMYSKAGQRIAANMGSEERVVSSARGNSLLRNTGSGYELLAGAVVEAADFGWGGTFFDANNDGTLDIYAPAGYVTMPAEVARPGDS